MSILTNDWLDSIGEEFKKPYYKELDQFVKEEYRNKTIFPPVEDVFNAFHFTPLSEVKVLLLGQDPYHNVNQAHGLSFSGCYIPNNGYLKKWADQGVLLLNTVLTVQAHQANSHQGRGWETFTDAVIKTVNEQDRPIVYFLFGKPAQSKKKMLTNPKHLIIEAPHPSPLSAYRGFYGSKPFSRANEFFSQHGIEPIDWQIENISE